MGTLYIVSTPIGNLKDTTSRALEILRGVDYVLCEDTRVTGRLLNHYQISKKMIPFHEHNEQAKIPSVIADLIAGGRIALVSDAGTPLISDPGFKLVRETIKNNIKVESIPGPTAAIAALIVSGLPSDKFLFIGYPPKKETRRRSLFSSLFMILHSSEDTSLKLTVIIYESPHKVVKTLLEIREIFGDIEIVICRELTKLHEEIRRERISESIRHFFKIQPKGEFTLLFHSKVNSEQP